MTWPVSTPKIIAPTSRWRGQTLAQLMRKSVFSVAAYREVLKRKGGDISQFDKEVDTKIKKGP